MTANVAPSRLRGAGAVAAGFVLTAVLSLATDVGMHALGVFPAWGEPMSGGLFVWATIYRVAYTVVGGYVTATLAPVEPMSYVMILAGIGLLAATAGAVATWNAGPALGPRWYPLLLVVTAVPCVWTGGMLRVGRARRRVS
jgi:hypothetical protein